MKQKVALVLSGGGARGIAHIGVIQELEKQGFEICSIAGTSMGAVVGGIYALGKMNELKEWLFTLDKIKVFSLIDFTFNHHGFIKGDKVLAKMQEFISDKNIENLDIPYTATATDIINSKEVVFTQGSVYDAIRASISIPTVIKPVKVGKSLLVDGGVLNNIPINNVVRQPNDLLVVVDVNAKVPLIKPFASKKENEAKQSVYMQKITSFYNHLNILHPAAKEEKLSFFNLLDKTISLMMHHSSELLLKQHKIDMLINISRESCSTFDFFKAEELVEIGQYVAAQMIDGYKKEHLSTND